jgi:general secretion pathway protein D
VVRVAKPPCGLLSARRALIVAVFAFSGACLAACNLVTLNDTESYPPDVFDRVRSVDLLPRSPAAQEPNANASDRRRPAVYAGETVTALAASDTRGATKAAAGGEGYELNFENTPVTNIAKVVLGDILGVGYTIDPRVQGTISLASGRPVPKADILFVLENALRVSNVVLVRETAGYRIIPLGDAIGSGNLDSDPSHAEPGYGISVVPLQYVSAQTLIKLLDSFAAKPGAVRADAARNMILIQGSGAERRAAIETVLSFDAEWMQGQSVGIFPVRNSTPEPIITELEKIVDSSDGGLGQNLIKFQSIGRMNSILVVARKPQLLKTAATWIKRLDNGDNNSGISVRVYRVRYGEARQMAKVLNDIFLGSGSGGLESPVNQIAPGSGAVATSSGDQMGSGGQFGTGFGTPSNANSRVRQQLGITPPNQHGGTTEAAAAPAAATPALADARTGSASGAPMLSGVRITPDVVNNSLLIYASQENYRIIERALQQIDRPQMQVAIDATIAEVTLNNDLNYGVQFFLTSHDLGLKPDKGSALNTAATQPPAVNASGIASAFLNRAFPGFNFLVGPEAQPQVILDALHAVTSVKVLSNPSLVVIDNQPAILQVGDQVPVSTGSATVLTTSNTIVNTIDYRDTGIILRVVPRVNVNGIVRLDIEQEISNVTPTSGSAITLTPTVSQRRVKSSVSITSGQTVLLAGLISERQERGSNGIPLLDRLPQPLGDVFTTNRTNALTRTELIIFIRPQVIRDGVDAHFVAEEMRAKLRGIAGAEAPSGPLTTRLR